MDDEQTIELDCAPGTPRPDCYIYGVIKDTGLPVKETEPGVFTVDREPVSKCFGCWTWCYNDVTPEVWAKAKPILEERITKLYTDGAIRYGSW